MSRWQITLTCCLIVVVAKVCDCYSSSFCTNLKFEKWCFQYCDTFHESEQTECERVNEECGCKEWFLWIICILLVTIIIPTICCCCGIFYFLNKSKKGRGQVLKLPHNYNDRTVHTISQPYFVPPPPYSKSNHTIIPENCMPMQDLARLPETAAATPPVMI